MEVWVVYAEPERQTQRRLLVPVGTTVGEALDRANLRADHPALSAPLAVGIWGREVTLDTPVTAGDRIELYRPLPQDPKDTRRALAREGRSMGGGVGMRPTGGRSARRRR